MITEINNLFRLPVERIDQQVRHPENEPRDVTSPDGPLADPESVHHVQICTRHLAWEGQRWHVSLELFPDLGSKLGVINAQKHYTSITLYLYHLTLESSFSALSKPIFQVNIYFSECFKLCKFCKSVHCFSLINSAKIHQKFRYFPDKSACFDCFDHFRHVSNQCWYFVLEFHDKLSIITYQKVVFALVR